MQYSTREQMVEMVKAVGREVTKRAEDLVGDTEGMRDMDIWLRFPQYELPRIEVSRSIASKECFGFLVNLNQK